MHCWVEYVGLHFLELIDKDRDDVVTGEVLTSLQIFDLQLHWLEWASVACSLWGLVWRIFGGSPHLLRLWWRRWSQILREMVGKQTESRLYGEYAGE